MTQLREAFETWTPEESKQKHQDDHRALHEAHNDVIRMPKPKVSSAENSASLKDALRDAVSGGFGCTLRFKRGVYSLNDYFTAQNVRGLRIEGNGQATVLNSTLNNINTALFDLNDCRECVIKDLYINAVAPIGAVVRTRNVSGGTVTPSMNLFENIHVEGQGKLEYGGVIGGMDYIDANNDFNTFRRCYFLGYTKSGSYMRACSQSYDNVFEGCYFFGANGAEHAVNAGGNFGGNFHWYGGFVGGHAKSDFNIGRSYQPYIIHGMNSEVSARFITTDSQAYCTIEAKANRWAGNAAHADGKIIKLSGDVTATFENNALGDGSGDRALTIELANLQAVSSVKFNNNRVFSSAAAVFDTTAPHEMSGNSQFTHEGNGTKKVLTA